MKHWGIIWLLSGDCLDEALRYVVTVILVITGVIVFLFCFIFCVGTDFMDWTLERVYITII